MFKRILVTTDGSETSLRGVEGAAKFAVSLDAELIILTVKEAYSYATVTAYRPESYEQHSERVGKEAEKALEAAKKVAVAQGAAPKLLAVEGLEAADAILRTCSERHCDVIVMASRGKRGLQAMIIGSVTRQVLLDAPVPVLVYR